MLEALSFFTLFPRQPFFPLSFPFKHKNTLYKCTHFLEYKTHPGRRRNGETEAMNGFLVLHNRPGSVFRIGPPCLPGVWRRNSKLVASLPDSGSQIGGEKKKVMHARRQRKYKLGLITGTAKIPGNMTTPHPPTGNFFIRREPDSWVTWA